MSTYKVEQPFVAPLLVQLTVPSGTIATVKRIAIMGRGTTGKASRVYVYYPSVPGSGSGTINKIDRASPNSQCTVVTSFASVPSLPLYTLFTNPVLPMVLEWSGEITLNGGSLVVFQDCQSGYGTGAEIEWEESPAN